MTQKYYVIKYSNPNYETKYCINGSKDAEHLKEYWKLYESPHKYNLLDMIEITDEEKAKTWLSNHKTLSVRINRKNLKFLNDITNGNFLKNMYDVPFCPHCGKKLDVSDINEYTWQCFDCDEDFYRVEVE